jgi:hypothetical protein
MRPAVCRLGLFHQMPVNLKRERDGAVPKRFGDRARADALRHQDRHCTMSQIMDAHLRHFGLHENAVLKPAEDAALIERSSFRGCEDQVPLVSRPSGSCPFARVLLADAMLAQCRDRDGRKVNPSVGPFRLGLMRRPARRAPGRRSGTSSVLSGRAAGLPAQRHYAAQART